jgi:hypothetical protein
MSEFMWCVQIVEFDIRPIGVSQKVSYRSTCFAELVEFDIKEIIGARLGDTSCRNEALLPASPPELADGEICNLHRGLTALGQERVQVAHAICIRLVQ